MDNIGHIVRNMKTSQQQSREIIYVWEKISLFEVIVRQCLLFKSKGNLGQVVNFSSNLLVEVEDHLLENKGSRVVSFEHSMAKTPELNLFLLAFFNESWNVFN